MKRIFLFLAATAVLASSCMKENAFENLDGKVTVKAVASDTKTLVDGTSVVWENDDKISVVVVADYKYAYNFDAETVNGAAADFVGTIGQSEYDEAYAVYPASAVNVDNTTWVTHTLAETQTGVVTSGMNLSSALLDAEALKNGGATATFKNALTLLQVTVPSGVASVALTSSTTDNGLVGTANFTMNADGALVFPSRATQRRTVTLSTGSELEAGTYSLLVYPGNYSSLTLTMTGTDGAVYESAISATFEAGEYRPINLTEIFKMKTEDEMFISPAGGECEVKIASVADYTYEVSITDNTGNWLSYTLPTKGFHQDVITFSAEENTTGADRTANVTIKWGEDQTRTFKMTQRAVYMDFVNDENGDPIQWEESFGVYASEAEAEGGLNPKATFTNVFTIGLSDDFSKGAYKIENMFAYQNKTGTTYYADYAAGELTIYVSAKAAPERSYYFKNDEVVLIYDSSAKTFASKTTTIPAGTRYDFITAIFGNKDCFLGGYSVAVKSEEPETPGEDSRFSAFVGTWKESWTYGGWGGSTDPDSTFEVRVVDGKLYFENMFYVKANYGTSSGGNYYGELSEDGKTITLSDDSNFNGGMGHPSMGPIMDASYTPTTLAITVQSDGVLTLSTGFNGYLSNYTATRQ